MVTLKKKLVVRNRQGLHARPAALFVQIANKFDSEVTVVKDDMEVNGKSIMGILTLAAEKDSSITIVATGKDAHQALLELEKIITVEETEQKHKPQAPRVAGVHRGGGSFPGGQVKDISAGKAKR
jgi:phosphotransferase system HPr (HPr) family protein